MRYDLTDFEWSVIEPILPKGRRGQQPQNNRRVMNGIFWVLRTGAPWRDLPERYGPYTTAYNRFNRWRKAAIWDGLMAAVTKAHGGKVQMIDRARASACLRGQKKSGDRCVGRSRGGLSTKIHARVDHQGRPIQILITPGQAHDLTGADPLLANLGQDTIIIADKAYDADRLRAHIKARGAIANIPNMIRRKKRFRWTKAIYRERNHVERFFNKLKQFRRIATRYDKLGATFLAFIQLAAVRISLRSIESTT